jgi:hypothetical protein
MKIRKAAQKDMPFVLELIQELAAFEKEPEAVVVTVDDLIRLFFNAWLPKKKTPLLGWHYFIIAIPHGKEKPYIWKI